MREFKFRAYDTENKEMQILDAICLNQGYKKINGFYEFYDEKDIMQYTGLKDINGKEIYEGDILEGGYLNPLTGEFISRKYIVEYEKGCFKCKLIGKSPYGDTWINFINEKSRVIGTIYDDLNLLDIEEN